MGKERFSHLVGNKITVTDGVGVIDDEFIHVAPFGNDQYGGGILSPYKTITKALSAVTSTRKKIMVRPGTYAEITGMSWPTVSGVQLIGVGNRWETVISAAAGDEVIDVAPGAQDSTFELTIQNIQIDHDESGQDGLVLTHTSVTKKMNVYLGHVGMAGDSGDYGLKVVHGGSGNAVRIYWNGDNGAIESAIDLDSEDGGDRFYVEGVEFEADIDAGAANTTQTIRLKNCQILHEGFTGGGSSGVVMLAGCYSKTGTTYAPADNLDVTTNSSLTAPNVLFGSIDDGIIYVSPGGLDTNQGRTYDPYLTVTAAFAAVTNTRKVVRLLPGIYTEAATLDWPDFDDVVLEGMGARNDMVTIVGASGEDVIDIDPTTKTSTFDASITGLTIDGDGDCSGLRIDNGGVGSGIKLIVYLNDVNISMNEDTYEAIECVHVDNKTEALRIYHHGNNEFEGLMVIEPEYAGDRYYFNGAKFPTGFAIGNGAVAARFEFRNCIFANDSASGDEGHDSQICAVIGSASETGGTYAAVDKEDIGTNISSNMQII